MLVGRDDERRRIQDLLQLALEGTSGVLVIRGEAGMGKTALIAYAANRGSDFVVLSAAGVESESQLAFAGLVAICRPVVEYLDRIPRPQRMALQTALAISDGRVFDRFTVYAGLLGLLAAAAEARPLLVIVDDLHSLDVPSAEAVLFVARRFGPDRISIIMATRAGEDGHLDLKGLSPIHLTGLSREAALKLLRQRHGRDALSDEVAYRLVDLTEGAPLALVEIPVLLTPAQLIGAEPLPDPLPVGDSVQRAFHRQIAALPNECVEALLFLSADDTGSLEVVTRAIGEGVLAEEILEPAERAGVIRIVGGRAEFRHPLLRSAVYYGTPPVDRRATHRALADAYASDGSARRAWHRAAATVEADETVAAELDEAAAKARTRGGYASAATTLERAAQLTPDREGRARRLLAAADSHWLAGQAEHAMRLLDLARPLTDDPRLSADIQLLRGRLLFAFGSVTDEYAALIQEASRIESDAPEKAVMMLMEACWACVAAAELERGLKAGEHAARVAARLGGNLEHAAGLALAEALIVFGRTREARPLLDRWKRAVEASQTTSTTDIPFHPTTGVVYLVAEDYSFARQLLDGFLATARHLAAPALLPLVLGSRSALEFRIGDWAAAYAHATEADLLAADMRQDAIRPFVLVHLARVEAATGREEGRAHAHQAEDFAERHGTRSLRSLATAAIGLLDLGAGRIDEAIVSLESVDHLMREWRIGDPNIVQSMPDLIEGYVRVGERTKAEAVLETLNDQAERTDGNWARATAARCAGMLADAFDNHFIRALELHDRTPTPFERARTELCFGERLRRAGRRAEARAHLRSAHATFDRLGAVPWRSRASAELGGSVEHLASRDRGIDRLSPQELQVALLVSDGATNREAAAALFVTTKTVEFHLRNIYRKLVIRSRTELARVVASRRGPGLLLSARND